MSRYARPEDNPGSTEYQPAGGRRQVRTPAYLHNERTKELRDKMNEERRARRAAYQAQQQSGVSPQRKGSF